MNYCICASGNLGLIVLRHFTASQLSIKCLLTDAKSREIREYCIRNKIPYFVGIQEIEKPWNGLMTGE